MFVLHIGNSLCLLAGLVLPFPSGFSLESPDFRTTSDCPIAQNARVKYDELLQSIAYLEIDVAMDKLSKPREIIC